MGAPKLDCKPRVLVRVSYNFSEQLEKVQEALESALDRTVTIAEITEKIPLRVVIVNKGFKNEDLDVPGFELAPIVIVLNGIRKSCNRKARLEVSNDIMIGTKAQPQARCV